MHHLSEDQQPKKDCTHRDCRTGRRRRLGEIRFVVADLGDDAKKISSIIASKRFVTLRRVRVLKTYFVANAW
jgi:hypothetical protein